MIIIHIHTMDKIILQFDTLRTADANHKAEKTDKTLLAMVIAINKINRSMYAYRNEHLKQMRPRPIPSHAKRIPEPVVEEKKLTLKVPVRARRERAVSVAFDDFEIIEHVEVKKEDVKPVRKDNVKKPKKKSKKK